MPYIRTVCVLAAGLGDGASAQEEYHLNCRKCREVLVPGHVTVVAERVGEQAAWHPQCFTCCTCEVSQYHLNCHKCKEVLMPGHVAVVTERVGEQARLQLMKGTVLAESYSN